MASVPPPCLNAGAMEGSGRAIQSGVAAALTGGAAPSHKPPALHGESRAGEGEGEGGGHLQELFTRPMRLTGAVLWSGGGRSYMLGCSISASSMPRLVAQ